MNYNNEHLNIFHHYSQNGSIPIENNISRGLAILFQEYPALLIMFLDKIQHQVEYYQEALNLDGVYSVNFQKRISDFSCPENIVGVSLTVAEGLDETWNEIDSKNTTADPITDISIEFNDTIVIIEVKRTTEDCNAQLKEQMKRLKSDSNSKMWDAHFTWTDIIKLIENYRLILNKDERILDDYYSHICSCFPSWCPVRNLSEISKYDILAQKKRLSMLVNKYNKDNNLQSAQYIDLTNAFDSASELHVWVDENETKETQAINFGIWPCSTRNQYNQFLSNSSFEFLKGLNDSTNDIKNSVCIFIRLYNTFGSSIYSIVLDENKIASKEEYEAFCKSIMGKWGRNKDSNKWDKFYEIVTESDYISEESKQKFEEYYKDIRDHSNMNYFNAILSIEIIGRISYEKAQEYDKNNSFSKLIKDHIDYLQKEIEDLE